MKETDWKRLVAGRYSFAPEILYPEVTQILDLCVPQPKWELYTADDLWREDQKGTRVYERDMARAKNYLITLLRI